MRKYYQIVAETLLRTKEFLPEIFSCWPDKKLHSYVLSYTSIDQQNSTDKSTGDIVAAVPG